MQFEFDPPSDLVDFVWAITVAAAKSVGLGSPFHVASGRKTKAVSAARYVLAMVARDHIWVERLPLRTDTHVRIGISFGRGCPFESRKHYAPRPISTPMLGWLLGLDHSSLVAGIKRARTQCNADQAVEMVTAELAKEYGQDPVIVTARLVRIVRSRRMWAVPSFGDSGNGD